MTTTVRTNARAGGGSAPTPLEGWACSHPYFTSVVEWVLRYVLMLYEPAVLLIVGPTGVGKTTVIAYLRRMLAQRLEAVMSKNPSLLATVLAEATYLPGRGFDWKSLFEDLLHDGGEVLVDRKVDKAWIAGSGSLQALSRAANNMLLHHQPALAVIDEGGGLVEAGTIDALKHNIGYLKSLGNRSRTHIAIFGDYSLARLAEFSGQLNRRCHTVHFPPYGVEQLSSFEQIVASFERRYVTKGVPASLCGSTPLLFEGSCGCVGLLHRWVEVAEIEAAAAKRPLDAEMLMRTAPPQGAVDRWKTEIAQGQAAMARYFGGEKL